jgi:hypothetical protein
MVFQPYNRNALIKWYDENAANYDDLSYKQDQASYGGDAYRIVLVKKLLDGLGIKDGQAEEGRSFRGPCPGR